jgi:hypothetical protein
MTELLAQMMHACSRYGLIALAVIRRADPDLVICKATEPRTGAMAYLQHHLLWITSGK